jgi:hypothetical protein
MNQTAAIYIEPPASYSMKSSGSDSVMPLHNAVLYHKTCSGQWETLSKMPSPELTSHDSHHPRCTVLHLAASKYTCTILEKGACFAAAP